ncbi:MAG TPA: acyl carrier protein [Acetobacteraceae bacterium]|jgi:acyl carrier protein|nr:acyl carrier protein [Acetobacteraceae bacterium]
MKDRLERILTTIIATKAHLDPQLVVPEATLSDLGVTSLDLVEIIMTIEDEYDVTIPGNAVEASNSYKTVGDLIKLGASLNLEGGSRES